MAFKRTKKAIKKTTDGIKKTSRNIKKTTDDISDNITDNIDETKFKIKMKANEFADNIDKTKKKITKKADELAKDIRKKLIALAFIAFSGFFIWLLFTFLYFVYGFNVIAWIKNLPYIYPIFQHIFDQIAAQSQQGLYYMFSFSSIFVFPVPLEFVFFGFLKQGFAPKSLYLITIAGVFTGQNLNFFFGRFLGFLIKPYIKKRTRRALRRRLHKYGVFAIAFMHLLPLPYPLFNFVVGLTKYNYFKWIIVMLPSLLINYLIFYWIYLKWF